MRQRENTFPEDSEPEYCSMIIQDSIFTPSFSASVREMKADINITK
jgi:hypothetical protein